MHLDVPSVLREATEQLHEALGARATSMWLGRPGEEPNRAVAVGKIDPDTSGPGPLRTRPALISEAAARGTTVRASSEDLAAIAAPVIAPQSGPLGVLYVEVRQLLPDGESIVTEIARETGFALETANLYEAAVAEKEKSEAILARVGEAVVVTDARGTIKQWNHVAGWHLGWDPAMNGGPRTCAALLGLYDGEESLDCSTGCALLALQQHGDAGTTGRELWRSRIDGRRQPLLATASPLVDSEGTVFEVVHSLRDVTRLKEAEEAKNLFLATASHELRTPLTVIQGFAQLLQSASNEDGTWDTALDAIARRSLQLNSIVERILLSSRIEAGRVEVHARPLRIEPILREEVNALAASRGREVTLTITDALPEAHADPTAVTSIVQHLLENALKYSPSGGPIEARAWADARRLSISIGDHGVGMDEEQVVRCFDKFWQAESTDVRRFGGTGIGLYIVRSLALAMDGDVRVESVPGVGSTFTVSLPVAGAPILEAGSPPLVAAPPNLANDAPVSSERSTIQEFMRQIGIPARRRP